MVQIILIVIVIVQYSNSITITITITITILLLLLLLLSRSIGSLPEIQSRQLSGCGLSAFGSTVLIFVDRVVVVDSRYMCSLFVVRPKGVYQKLRFRQTLESPVDLCSRPYNTMACCIVIMCLLPCCILCCIICLLQALNNHPHLHVCTYTYTYTYTHTYTCAYV